MTPEEELRRFRILERDKLEDKHAPKIERALREQITAIINEDLTDFEIANAPNRLDEHSAELEAALLAFAFAMSGIGIDAAQDDLASIALAIDPAEADAAGKALARQQVNLALSRLNETTRKALQAAIPAWLLQDARDVDDLLKELEPQMNRARATNIARTEGTAIFKDGVSVVGAGAGVTQFQWYTMQDERVCVICKPMLGKRRSINGQYQDGTVSNPPPAHPRCRCGELMVIRSIEA